MQSQILLTKAENQTKAIDIEMLKNQIAILRQSADLIKHNNFQFMNSPICKQIIKLEQSLTDNEWVELENTINFYFPGFSAKLYAITDKISIENIIFVYY